MNKVFDKILKRLESEFGTSDEVVIELYDIKKIVQELAEEYSYLSKGFDSGLLKRIADYFSSVYEGDDISAPKMELSVYELREIASLHVEKCRLQTEIDKSKEYNGWIPCSERLPDEAFGCLVTVMDCEPSTQTDFENILPYFVGYDGHSWNDADGNEIPFEVIAWQPLPEKYHPKEE